MATKITIDNAGRIVIPKAVRKSLQLQPGDALELDATGGEIILKPIHDTIALAKEEGIWVYRTGAALTNETVMDLIDQIQEDRVKETIG